MPTLAGVADLLAGTVLPRVLKIALFIALGVTLADLLVSFGAVERIAALSKYLTRPANLPDEVGAAIVTTAASTTAGYGMLAEFRESGRLDDRATLVAVTVNTFFGFVQHIFTFYAPVLIPILGLEVGLMYVGARAAIALAITLTGILAGAVLLSPPAEAADEDDRDAPVEADGGERSDGSRTAREQSSRGPCERAQSTREQTSSDEQSESDGGEPSGARRNAPAADAPAEDTTTPEKLRGAVESGLSKTRDVLPRLAVIYTAVVLLTTYYDLEAITAAADPLAEVVGLPVAAVPVIAVFAIDTTNGALVIAPLVPGTFTPEQAVATMLVGGIVSFAVSTFKRSIPFQYGIWGAEFGSKVVVVNTALKVGFIGAAVALLLYGPL